MHAGVEVAEDVAAGPGGEPCERHLAAQPELDAAGDDGHLPPCLDQSQAQPEVGGVGEPLGGAAAHAAHGPDARAPPRPLHVGVYGGHDGLQPAVCPIHPPGPGAEAAADGHAGEPLLAQPRVGPDVGRAQVSLVGGASRRRRLAPERLDVALAEQRPAPSGRRARIRAGRPAQRQHDVGALQHAVAPNIPSRPRPLIGSPIGPPMPLYVEPPAHRAGRLLRLQQPRQRVPRREAALGRSRARGAEDFLSDGQLPEGAVPGPCRLERAAPERASSRHAAHAVLREQALHERERGVLGVAAADRRHRRESARRAPRRLRLRPPAGPAWR